MNLLDFATASFHVIDVEVPAAEEDEGEAELELSIGEALPDEALRTLPIDGLEHAYDIPLEMTILSEENEGSEIILRREPGSRRSVRVRLSVEEGALEGRYGVVHLVERDARGIVGGVTFVLVHGGSTR